MSDRILDKLPLAKAPMFLKLFFAKVLIRMMSVNNMWNDITLYNELKVYIDTHGRPTTSNAWFWINK